MKVGIWCSKCTSRTWRIGDGNPSPIKHPIQIYPARLTEHLLYELVCVEQHTTYFCLPFHPFEALVAVATRAILDGYYRESVSSFAAALERFHELTIRAILLAMKVEERVLVGSWKKVSNQSERQLGAYIFLATAHFSSAPTLDDRLVHLRNKVVHKGALATRAEAIQYGQAVLEVISKIKELMASDDAVRVAVEALRPSARVIGAGKHPTFFSTGVPDLEAEVARLPSFSVDGDWSVRAVALEEVPSELRP